MKASKGSDREARKGKLRDREAGKVRRLRQKQGFLDIGKQDSEVQGILLEGESRRLDIVTDSQFWKPIDTAFLDTSQASRILDLYKWEMDRLGIGLIQAVDRRVWKVRNGGHAQGAKAKADGPKAKGFGKPDLKPGKPTQHGKRRYKPSRKGSAFDRVCPVEARSASLLWLVDTMDGKQAGIYAQARGKQAWLPMLSRDLQAERLEACRQAYFVQDKGTDPLPTDQLRKILDKIPQPKGSKAWGYATMQHTCLNCGHKHYDKPTACDKCGNESFRSEAIGPTASLLKAVAQAVGRALSKGKLRYPGEAKQDPLCEVSLEALAGSQADTDGKPCKWEAVQESLYSHIEARAMVRLSLQEAKQDPKGDRLIPIILGKLRGHDESLILRNIRRKLADKQALKAGTDPGRLRDLGINPPKYSRRTYFYDLAEVRRIGKLCRRELSAQAEAEAEAWLVQDLGDILQDQPKPIREWYREAYRSFRRLRKQGLTSDLQTFLDKSQGKADPKEAKQAEAVQEALRYCQWWTQHAFDRRKLADPDYPTDRLPDPEAYLEAKAVSWTEASHWLSIQEADKPKPTDRQSQADKQAEVAKRQAYRYCQWWTQHAFDRRQVQDQPESFLDFNRVTWDQSKAWLRIGSPTEAKA